MPVEAIAAWTSPYWVCNVFPQPGPDVEIVSLSWVMAALDRHTSQITDADSTALGAAMHVAHVLVTLQGDDGLWPEQLNLRTGRGVGEGRCAVPVQLMRRLNQLLFSTEYDSVISRAEKTLTSRMDSVSSTGLLGS